MGMDMGATVGAYMEGTMAGTDSNFISSSKGWFSIYEKKDWEKIDCAVVIKQAVKIRDSDKKVLEVYERPLKEFEEISAIHSGHMLLAWSKPFEKKDGKSYRYARLVHFSNGARSFLMSVEWAENDWEGFFETLWKAANSRNRSPLWRSGNNLYFYGNTFSQGSDM